MRKPVFCIEFGVVILLASTICYGAENIPKKEPKVVAPRPATADVLKDSYKSNHDISIGDIEERCIDENPTQGGMNVCYGKSLEAWDKALNEEYRKLYKLLDNDGKASLKNAQREWIKYRDSHYRFLDVYYDKFEGSMYNGMYIRDKSSVVRDRTLILIWLNENMKDLEGN